MVSAVLEEKIHYNVYKKIKYNDGCGNIFVNKIFIGDTYAVSQQKAISNVRYRRYGRRYNKSFDDLGNDSSNTILFVAEQVCSGIRK